MLTPLRDIGQLVVLGVMASAACSNSGPQTVSDSKAYLAETAIGSMNSALTDDEKTGSIAAGGAGNAASRKMVISRSLAATSCGTTRYVPALGSLSCAGTAGNDTVTSVLNCTIDQGVDQLLKGTVTLSFDDPNTCGEWLTGAPTSGSMTWTASKLLRTTTDFSGVTTSSQPSNNYKGVAIGGGIKTSFGTGTSIDILGLHVLRQASGNVTVFDHSITTPAALSVTGTLAEGTRSIASGTVVIDHNIQNFTATGTISGLKWASSTCCLPSEGSINFALSGSAIGNIFVNFDTGTCGKVSISDASVVATPTKPSPSPIPSGMASNYTALLGGCQ
jgi:hypothetical protein